jgi:hypothetical protein
VRTTGRLRGWSAIARRIEVELVADATKLQRGFAQATTAAKKWDRQMKQTTAASKSATASLGAVAIGWQTAVAGGALLLAKRFVAASRNAEIVLGQTRVGLSDAGLSWQQYGKQIEDASTRISNSSAFDDEAVLQSFAVFVRGQKDVTRSLQLTELAADIARARYIDLEQATKIVTQASMGNVGALRRQGVMIDKNATAAEALDQLLQTYTGHAKTYADSATGSSEKLAVAWENLAETTGGPLSNALANLADQLTIIVGLMQKTKDLSESIPDGGFLGKVLKGAATGILPGFALPGIVGALGGGRGGALGPATPTTMPVPPTSRFFFGKTPEMGAGSFFDAIDNIVAFTTKWVEVGRKFDEASKAWEAKQKAAAARRDRMQLQRERFRQGLANQWGWLEFGVERAGATKTLADDRRALHKQEAWLKNRIAHEGRTLRLVSDLWRVRQQIRDLNKKKAKDGDPLAGLMQVSSKRLAQTLAAGTGLGPGGMGRLQANIAGAEIQPVHSYVVLDGRVVASSVSTHQTRGGARTARQTSGFRG